MAPNLRTWAALLILVAGIVLSVQLDTGRSEPEPAAAAYSAAEPAIFEMALRRGTLILEGNTVSTDHEEQLRQAAATYFPGVKLREDFRPLGVAPDWWNEVTNGLLASLSTIRSPNATLRPNRLQVSGFAAHDSVAQLQLQALEGARPDTVVVDARIEIAAADVTAYSLCERQFSSFAAGDIKFEESGTEFRASAYPTLDRIVALADACRDSTVFVTGHTDSSGDDTWNQKLSLERARAVATYLDGKGVDPGRVVTVGAGSSFPVADNATRYGRSLNRRIDIYFSAGLPD